MKEEKGIKKPKNNVIIISLVIIVSILILLIGGYFVYKNMTPKYSKTYENDTRVYPLVIEFYEDYLPCYKATNNTCVFINETSETYTESVANVSNRKKLGEYTCKNKDCEAKSVLLNDLENGAIYDKNIYFYDIENNKTINTEMTKDNVGYELSKVFEGIEILDNISNDEYDILLKMSEDNNSVGEIYYNVFNTKQKKLVFSKWYHRNQQIGDIRECLKKDENLYFVKDSDTKTLKILNNKEKILFEIEDNNDDLRFEKIIDDYILIYNYSNKKTYIYNKNDFALIKELNGQNYSFLEDDKETTDNYIYQIDGSLQSDGNTYTYIYNKKDLLLVKKLDNAGIITKHNVNGQIIYSTDSRLNTFKIFDNNFNVIIDEDDLPVKYDNSRWDLLLNVNIDKNNNFIALYFKSSQEEINDIYVFNLNGKFINTITPISSEEKVLQTFENFFLTQNGNNINVYDYNNKLQSSKSLQDEEKVYNTTSDKEYIHIIIKSGTKSNYEYLFSLKTKEITVKN